MCVRERETVCECERNSLREIMIEADHEKEKNGDMREQFTHEHTHTHTYVYIYIYIYIYICIYI